MSWFKKAGHSLKKFGHKASAGAKKFGQKTVHVAKSAVAFGEKALRKN